jgi:hypothetical protein
MGLMVADMGMVWRYAMLEVLVGVVVLSRVPTVADVDLLVADVALVIDWVRVILGD